MIIAGRSPTANRRHLATLKSTITVYPSSSYYRSEPVMVVLPSFSSLFVGWYPCICQRKSGEPQRLGDAKITVYVCWGLSWKTSPDQISLCQQTGIRMGDSVLCAKSFSVYLNVVSSEISFSSTKHRAHDA